MPKEKRLAIELWAKNGFPLGSEKKDETSWLMDKKPDSVLNSTMRPIEIDEDVLIFFDLMQGHWVGNIQIMGQKYNWFAFDYRPISSSHIHGIFEGGTMGNLFTSFFIAKFEGKTTIMARNGGILNGIYRTSYFVLDQVELSEHSKYFRLVDAYGGKEIMWMELEFVKDELKFNSYTSRFGLNGKPTLHMKFAATRKHAEVSGRAASILNYPSREIAVDFSKGLPYPNWGEEYAVVTSASYIYSDRGEDLQTLADLSGDPYSIKDIPYLSKLRVQLESNEKIKNAKLLLYLSLEPLTDDQGKIIMEYGHVNQKLFDGILSFPELTSNETQFTFTYLHPGNYYLTIVADVNGDGFVSEGDLSSKSRFVRVDPESIQSIKVENILIQN